MRQTNRCSLWRALQHVLIPATVAAAIAFFCQPVYLADGKCDFGLLALLIGIPFGIQKMVVAGCVTIHPKFVGECSVDCKTLAHNDGLSEVDWRNWFERYDLTEPLAVIHFTKFRYR